jgi:uncharacterized Zn finger protein (UPF0148 family)
MDVQNYENGTSSVAAHAEEMGRSTVIRPTSISAMGQLLLQGYAMLADSCEDCAVRDYLYLFYSPLKGRKDSCMDFYTCVSCIFVYGTQVPLMREPQSEEALCVNCGKVVNGSQQPSGDQLLRPVLERVEDTVAEGRRSPILSNSDVDPSQALADKMLEGWTLLAEHCPRCATPLVRSRQGRMHCVSCQMDVVAQVSQPRRTEARFVGHVVDNGSNQKPDADSITYQGVNHQTIIPVQDAHMEGSNPQDDGLLTALTTTHQAVLSRMSGTAQGLEGASAADAAQRLEEILQCVQVLRGLQDLGLKP